MKSGIKKKKGRIICEIYQQVLEDQDGNHWMAQQLQNGTKNVVLCSKYPHVRDIQLDPSKVVYNSER